MFRQNSHHPHAAIKEEANQQHALILISDKDFGEMVFRQGRFTHSSVLVRMAGLSLKRKGRHCCLSYEGVCKGIAGKTANLYSNTATTKILRDDRNNMGINGIISHKG